MKSKGASRNLLAYFFESEVWKLYKRTVVTSYVHWMQNDSIRAEKCWIARSKDQLGVTVKDHIYDVFDCINKSKLKPNTKSRLYLELQELEMEHEEKNTLSEEI